MRSSLMLLIIFGILFPLSSSAQKKVNVADLPGDFFASFDGSKIYYETTGEGRPVILIHGFIVSGESWKRTPLYQDLVKKGYQVITIDLRGNGNSDKPHRQQAYENDAEVMDIMALADILVLKKYDVVGYARGAIIASRLMLRDKRVNRVVLGGMGSDFTKTDWQKPQLFYDALSGKPSKALQGMVSYVKKAGLDQEALAMSMKAQPSVNASELKSIAKPVMVIAGANDKSNGSTQDLAAMIPGSTYVTVPGDNATALPSQKFSSEVIKFFSLDKG